MIARIWHRWTKPADAKKYEQLLRTKICPELRAATNSLGAIEFIAGPVADKPMTDPELKLRLTTMDEHSGQYRFIPLG